MSSVAASLASSRYARRIANVDITQTTIALTGPAIVVASVLHGHVTPLLTDRASVHHATEGGLMAAGMMLPVASLATPLVMRRSLPSRRVVAATEFCIGFACIWAAFGIAVAAGLGHVASLTGPTPDAATAAFVAVSLAAAWWQVSRRRAILLRRCGRLRCSPARGVRSHVGNVRAGADQAGWCVRSCAPAMAAMLMAPSALAMVVIWLAGLSEWMPGPNPFGTRRRARPAIALVLVALGASLVTAI